MNDTLEARFVEAIDGGKGGKWLIRVIRAGLSKNGNFYTDAALREAANLVNGVRVFEKSDEEHLKGAGKSVRNLIGGLSNAKFVEGTGADAGSIVAELRLIEPEGPASMKLRSAYARGLTDLFGFSIDARGIGHQELLEGKRIKRVERIEKVNSVDLIVEPGAGGELVTLLEAAPECGETLQKTESGMELKKIMIAAIEAKRPGYDASAVTDEQLAQDYREAIEADLSGETRLAEAKNMAKRTIEGAKLPEYGKARVLERFMEASEPFTEKQVINALEAERHYLARASDAGKPRTSFHDIEVEDRSTKVADMLDAFFDPEHKNHGRVRSFRECYIEVTGDREVRGDIRSCDLPRLREAAGQSLREAVLSSTWANVLGDAITRRMLSLYAGETDLQAWRKVCSVVPVSDFRTQERVRVGGYGNLPAVAERGLYAPLASPGDDKATYSVSKRGGTEVVTLEAIANDDVQAISRIPDELMLAAANTLYEFVFDFFRTNPAIYDGNPLFHASRNNLFTAELDAVEFAKHRMAMVQQTRAGSNKRLGIKPAMLLVPFELEERAFNLFQRSDNLDPDFVQAIKPEIVTVPYWTDPNNWCTVARPGRLPVIEVGFLNGQETPEIFMQDLPNSGSLFSNDEITYKIRHIYGATVTVDGAKAATKAVVA